MPALVAREGVGIAEFGRTLPPGKQLWWARGDLAAFPYPAG